MLLLISSLNMLNAQPAERRPARTRSARRKEGRARRLDRGRAADHPAAHRPGDDVDGGHLRRTDAALCWELAILVGYGVVIGLATGVTFSLAEPIARVLGKTGINVMTRLMGLILAALAVEVMADGLGTLFPVLHRAT